MKKTLLMIILTGQAFFAFSQTVVKLTVTQPEKLVVSVSDDVSINEGATTTLTANVIGGTEPYYYYWDPATGLTNETILSTDAHPTDTTTYTISVYDQNDCSASASVTVNVVKKQSATHENTTDQIEVYPNPAGNYFYVSFVAVDALSEVSLYTLDGKQLWQKTINTNDLYKTSFDTPETSGMYLLKVISGDKIITSTIVVNHNK